MRITKRTLYIADPAKLADDIAVLLERQVASGGVDIEVVAGNIYSAATQSSVTHFVSDEMLSSVPDPGDYLNFIHRHMVQDLGAEVITKLRIVTREGELLGWEEVNKHGTP